MKMVGKHVYGPKTPTYMAVAQVRKDKYKRAKRSPKRSKRHFEKSVIKNNT